MEWDLGLKGVVFLVIMSLGFGIIAQFVAAKATTGWLWLIASTAYFVGALFTSEIWFGWATEEDLRFSSPFCGECDGESAAAEVDHGDDGGGAVVAVAAVVDQPDLGVQAFEFGVGQAELDGGEDLVAVGCGRSVTGRRMAGMRQRQARASQPSRWRRGGGWGRRAGRGRAVLL